MNAINKFIDEHNSLVVVVTVILVAIILTRLIRWLMNRSFVSASETIKVDATRFHFFKNAVTLIIWVVAIATITFLIPKLRALAITMFAGAGVFLAIIGFAAQQAFSNIVSGIFIVIFKPFRVGDMIQVGDRSYGTVEDITLRHTIITNLENKRIIIPNSVISSDTVINSSIEDESICEFLVFDISYDSDIDLAMKIMQDEARKHPDSFDNRTPEEKESGGSDVPAFVIGFGESSVKVRVAAWSKSPFSAREMHYELNKSIKQRFDQEGIEIPYPSRTIFHKNHPSAEK